jgi:hypothetical protein
MKALEVTWIPDQTITPPGPKMVVCVEPGLGFFFRINSKNHWRPCAQILKHPDHEWLDHDSFVECNILDLDEYLIEEAIRESGIVGVVSAVAGKAILAEVQAAKSISAEDKEAIKLALSPFL